MLWTVITALALLGIVLTVVFVQTSQSATDRRILHFLQNDSRAESEIRRILDVNRFLNPSMFTATLVAIAAVPLTVTSVDGVALQDQDLVLLTNQVDKSTNGIYVYAKSSRTLTKDSSQPSVGSVIHILKGLTFSGHSFLYRDKDEYISMAKTLLTNRYQTNPTGVLTFNPSHPVGMLFQ